MTGGWSVDSKIRAAFDFIQGRDISAAKDRRPERLIVGLHGGIAATRGTMTTYVPRTYVPLVR